MSRHWGRVQDLVEAVLSLMGLKADAVGENDNLAALGIDSMQLMEVCLFAACFPHVLGLLLLLPIALFHTKDTRNPNASTEKREICTPCA